VKNEPKVFRSLEEASGRFGPCAIAIGNFDGVHVGHQKLMRAALQYGEAHGLVPSALTFHPHPASVLAPERKLGFVFSIEERIEKLAEAGARHILVLPFTAELSRVSADGFVSQILVKALETKAVFVGENFRFGHRQGGNPGVLQALGRELGFESQFIQPVRVRGEVVSSSAIRRQVEAGNVARAGRLLGRCFSVKGPVVSGQGIGSRQTVPTLNLRPVPAQVLPRGVFVTETRDLDTGRRWRSITNVGVRPTFGGEGVTIETFLLGPLEGASPERIEVAFRHFVREERQFGSPEELKRQILGDVGRAQAYWRRVDRFKGLAFRTI
jgi:riboflavin kinase / FMN adenylyltransferase